MKAAVRHRYGPPEVLNLEEVRTPTPAAGEILVRVHAASVNLGDWEVLTGEPAYIAVLARLFGPKPRPELTPDPNGALSVGRRTLLGPKYKVLGTDIAGRVEAVGRDVERFQPGDEVFGDCGGFGAFAEYVCVPETVALAPKPPSLTFEQAAAIPQASFIALQGIRDKARVAAGQRVLINGAGGGAGTFAVQIAKAYGAEVTGVDGPHKLEMLRSIGADHVIDYTQESFTQTGQRYDAILDLAAWRTVFQSRRALAPGGIYLMAGGSGTALWQSMFLGPLLSKLTDRRAAFLLAESRRSDLMHMADLIESGIVRPVLDTCYPLAEAHKAFRRVGERHSQGKVVITA